MSYRKKLENILANAYIHPNLAEANPPSQLASTQGISIYLVTREKGEKRKVEQER